MSLLSFYNLDFWVNYSFKVISTFADNNFEYFDYTLVHTIGPVVSVQ